MAERPLVEVDERVRGALPSRRRGGAPAWRAWARVDAFDGADAARAWARGGLAGSALTLAAARP